MYNTQAEIVEEIVAAKNSDPVLAPINSTSTAAVWKRWVEIIAASIWHFNTILRTFETEITEIIKDNKVGTSDWYVEQAYDFQYGDNLVFVDNLYRYLVEDPLKKIIKRASYQTEVLDYGGIPISQTVIKVATEDNAGLPIPLDNTQLTAFNEYMGRNMFAGSYISTRSEPTDLLKLYGNVYYDPIYIPSVIKTNVITALQNYLKNLPFDAAVNENTLIGEVRKVVGVKDFVPTVLQVKPNGGAYTNLVREYRPFAGYITFDSAFDLNTTLIMVI